jgi:hypothetical protein
MSFDILHCRKHANHGERYKDVMFRLFALWSGATKLHDFSLTWSTLKLFRRINWIIRKIGTMGNLYTYDEKAAYEQRYHSGRKHTSYSSSNSSSSFDNEKWDYCNPNPPAYTYPFYNTSEEKPLPPLPGNGYGNRRVRFMVEKPLPPLWVVNWAGNIEVWGLMVVYRPKKRSSSRETEDAWWANGGQGVYESDEEDYDIEDEDKEKDES